MSETREEFRVVYTHAVLGETEWDTYWTLKGARTNLKTFRAKNVKAKIERRIVTATDWLPLVSSEAAK